MAFKAFGDRVKYWITINEPWVVAISGTVWKNKNQFSLVNSLLCYPWKIDFTEILLKKSWEHNFVISTLCQAMERVNLLLESVVLAFTTTYQLTPSWRLMPKLIGCTRKTSQNPKKVLIGLLTRKWWFIGSRLKLINSWVWNMAKNIGFNFHFLVKTGHNSWFMLSIKISLPPRCGNCGIYFHDFFAKIPWNQMS